MKAKNLIVLIVLILGCSNETVLQNEKGKDAFKELSVKYFVQLSDSLNITSEKSERISNITIQKLQPILEWYKRLFTIVYEVQLDSNTIEFSLSKNSFNAEALICRSVGEELIYSIVIFNSNANNGIVKNGFYLYDRKRSRMLFFKCLPNKLPYSKRISFDNLSTIAKVDTNFIDQEFYVYEEMNLIHKGFIKEGEMYNIYGLSCQNKKEYLCVKDTTNIMTIFEMTDSLRLSYGLRSYFNICPKTTRESLTLKWKLGYYNIDY